MANATIATLRGDLLVMLMDHGVTTASPSRHRTSAEQIRVFYGAYPTPFPFLRHVDHIVHEFVSYYNEHRPHQSLGNVPLSHAGQPPPGPVADGDIAAVRRVAYLGGLLNHYERKAA